MNSFLFRVEQNIRFLFLTNFCLARVIASFSQETYCSHLNDFQQQPAMTLKPTKNKKLCPRKIQCNWLIQYGLLVSAHDSKTGCPLTVTCQFCYAFGREKILERTKGRFPLLGPRAGRKVRMDIALTTSRPVSSSTALRSRIDIRIYHLKKSSHILTLLYHLPKQLMRILGQQRTQWWWTLHWLLLMMFWKRCYSKTLMTAQRLDLSLYSMYLMFATILLFVTDQTLI